MLIDFVVCKREATPIEEDIVAGGVFGSIGMVVDFESTGSFLTTVGFSFFGTTARAAKRVDYHNRNGSQKLLVN